MATKTTRLFIGNIRFTASAREIFDLLQPYDASNIQMVYDPATGQSRGFCYADVVEAEKAISDLDGQQYDGRTLHIEAARPHVSKAEAEFRRRRVA